MRKILILNSAVGVDARSQDVEMIWREGGAGHIRRVICPSRLKRQSAQQIAAVAPHPTAGFRLIVTFFCLSFISVHARPAGHDAQDAGETLIRHVADSPDWRPLPFLPPIPLHDFRLGPVTVPVTQHVIMMLISSAIVAAATMTAFRRPRILPSPLGSAIEPIALFVRDAIVYPAMGAELGRQWLPFFYTLFFFILVSNLLGLAPMFGSATANLSVTSALAVMVLAAVFWQGMKKNGVAGFFTNMVPPGVPRPIGLMLLCIEVFGLFIRNAVLSIRLFANMIAGHFVVFSLLMLIMLVHPLAGLVSVPMALFIDLLEVLVGIIQAFVFTLLAAIFIGMAATHH